MDYHEEKFKEHIKAVVEASQSTDDTLEERPLTLEELKELAISMGMTEEQWINLQKKAHEHLKAADDHLKKRNFREAIAEAEKATAINPYIANGNAVLAKSFMMLWLETHEDAHRDKAEFHSRQELKVDPRDQIAVNVLSTIDKKKRILAGDATDRKRIFLIIGGVLLLVILIGMAFRWMSNRNEVEHQESQQTEENQQIRKDLIAAEEEVNAQWDQVQVQIERRDDLLPQLFAVFNSSNEEAAALNNTIESLKGQIQNAEGEKKFQLMNDLDSKIQEMKLLAAESGAFNVKNLMIQIEGCENRIATEKRKYNDVVKSYNILAKTNADQFPEYEVKPYWSEN